MSSTHDPMETTLTRASPPVTDHDNEPDKDGDDSSESDGSYDGILRNELEAAFEGDFDFNGKFAVNHTFSSTPLPGLHVQGIGMIGFPLSDRDAKLIETVATQAPFGKGTETVVDTTVRDTFEINPDKFSFENPAWTDFLRTVTKTVADGLGLPPNLSPPRAELYKLLLYKTGSHFLPHKDTEKAQGMFGSLIIVLPSKFEGGQVHVSHGSSKDVFDISPSSESTTSALAWYTDVVHEVKPITSGYRLAISYNLVNIVPGLPPPHLPDMHAAVSVVERIFRRWKKGVYDFPDFHGTISYILDHQYTEAGLELAALKGKDAALVSNIRGVAEKQGVSLLLGLLEYEVSGDAGDNGGYDSESDSTPGMGIIHEQEYTIQGLYDLEGDLAEGMYPISLNPEYDLIPEDPEFDDQDPDDQEFEGYTGNEGAPIKHWYRRSVLFMSLAIDASNILLQMGGTEYACKKLRRWRAEGPTERNRKMARYIIDHAGLSSTLPEHWLLAVDLTLEWADFTMWQEVINESAKGGQKLKLSSDTLVLAWGLFTFDRTKDAIGKLIRDQSNIRASVDLINWLQAHAPGEDPNVKTWLRQQTTAVFSSIKSPPNVIDVPLFVSFAKSGGILFFSKTIVKQLVAFKHLFDFWVGLGKSLWKEKDKLLPSGGTPEEASAYTAALNHTIDSLIVAAIPDCRSDAAHTFGRRELADNTRIPILLDLMALTHRTQNLGQLVTLVSQPQGNLPDQYQKLTTSFIPELKARYQRYSKSSFPILDAFSRAFVEKWLQDLLGSPSKQPDALVKKLSCSCQDCARVNQFLRSNAVTETFRAAQTRISHMKSGLRALSGAVTLHTVTRGSPHGLQVTKTQGMLAMDKWSSRVESARAFLARIGTPDELARIMGGRYQDVQSALAGTEPYKISKPTPVVEDAPVAGTSTIQATSGGTRSGPIVAGVKRKAEDDGDVIDLT